MAGVLSHSSLYTSAQSDAWQSAGLKCLLGTYAEKNCSQFQQGTQGFLRDGCGRGFSSSDTRGFVCLQWLGSVELNSTEPSRKGEETQEGLQFELSVTSYIPFPSPVSLAGRSRLIINPQFQATLLPLQGPEVQWEDV